jgi:hypothetical protein
VANGTSEKTSRRKRPASIYVRERFRSCVSKPRVPAARRCESVYVTPDRMVKWRLLGLTNGLNIPGTCLTMSCLLLRKNQSSNVLSMRQLELGPDASQSVKLKARWWISRLWLRLDTMELSKREQRRRCGDRLKPSRIIR